MAAREMNHDPASGRFYFSESILTGATSEPVYVPTVQGNRPMYEPGSVYVKPAGGGSARIEFTLSPRSVIAAGSAVWLTWPNVNVTTDTSSSFRSPITALRCVSVSGATAWGVCV